MQSAQNAAACLVTGLGRREHNICPAAASLAASLSACYVQAGDVGLPFDVLAVCIRLFGYT